MKNIFKASMNSSASDAAVVITLVRELLTTGFLIFQSAGKMISGLVSMYMPGVFIGIYLFGSVSDKINRQLGSFIIYATKKNKTVLIETTDNRKAILIPGKLTKSITQLQG